MYYNVSFTSSLNVHAHLLQPKGLLSIASVGSLLYGLIDVEIFDSLLIVLKNVKSRYLN